MTASVCVMVMITVVTISASFTQITSSLNKTWWPCDWCVTTGPSTVGSVSEICNYKTCLSPVHHVCFIKSFSLLNLLFNDKFSSQRIKEDHSLMTVQGRVEQWLCNGHGSAENKELVLVISGETQLLSCWLTRISYEEWIQNIGFHTQGYFSLESWKPFCNETTWTWTWMFLETEIDSLTALLFSQNILVFTLSSQPTSVQWLCCQRILV